MKAQRKTNFQDVCSFNCAITNFFGFFHFTSNQNLETVHQCWRIVYLKFAFHVAFGLFASIKSSGVNIPHSTGSIIVNMGIRILIQLALYMPTAHRVFNFVMRHQHVKIIKNVQSIDDELFRMGIDINYRKHFIVAMVVTILYFNFLILTLFVDTKLTLKYFGNMKADPLTTFLAAYNVAAYLSFQISHMLIISTIYKRFQLVNQFLETKRLDQTMCRKISKLCSKLSDSLDLVNSCFTINLLNYFFKFIIFNIFFFFGIFHYMTTSVATLQELIFNTISSFYFVYFFWFGAWMITVSSWVKSEGCKMKMLIHSQTLTSPRALKACNLFCLQLDHQEPAISCGLFIVNWAYLLIVISGVFSYLIILVQYQTDQVNIADWKFTSNVISLE